MFEIEPFQIFGTDHLSVLIFILSLSILIPYFLRNQSETIKKRFGQGLAVLLITNELLKRFKARITKRTPPHTHTHTGHSDQPSESHFKSL